MRIFIFFLFTFFLQFSLCPVAWADDQPNCAAAGWEGESCGEEEAEGEDTSGSTESAASPQYRMPFPTPAPGGPDLEARPPECVEFTKKVDKCEEASAKAGRSCDPDKRSAFSKAIEQADGVTDVIAGVGMQAAQMGMAMGGCGGALLPGIQGGLSTANEVTDECRKSHRACDKSCDDLSSDPLAQTCNVKGRINTAVNTCEKQEVEESKMESNISKLAGSIASIQSCASKVTGTADISALQQYNCLMNPNQAACAATNSMTCGANNTSITCACQGGMASQACVMAMNKNGLVTTASNNAALEAARLNVDGKASGAAGLTTAELNSMMGGMQQGERPPGGDSEDLGGKKAGAAIDPGGSMGGAPDPRHQAAGGDQEGINKNILGGTGRGGGGGSSFGGGSGSPEKRADPRYAAGEPRFNLNNYKPNMAYQNYKRRDLAGITGPDGLVGPHGNFWANVKNRYYDVWLKNQLIKP